MAPLTRGLLRGRAKRSHMAVGSGSGVRHAGRAGQKIDAGNKIFQADGYEKYGPVLAQQLTPAMAVRCKGRAEMPSVTFQAEPAPLSVDLDRAALVIIDMQRDFLEPGGFGEALGNDVSRLQAAVAPLQEVLAAARRVGILVIHTREGHRPDLSDAPPHKVIRGDPATRIGAPGPMGRILVRGEPGHDIIPELYPLKEEPVIDKPGKGAFYQTDLEIMLRNRDIDTRCSCAASRRRCA